MIELIRKHISAASSRDDRINKTREVLQLLILRILFERNAFKNISFVGGTALRILYDLRRFSEDIDFSLTSSCDYNFNDLVRQLGYDLEHYGLSSEIKSREDRAVHSVQVRFPGILDLLEIASQRGQKLMIKIDIDSNPPAGWTTEVSLVNSIFMFSVKHFDVASLFATKLHACFFRKYQKGRDFYDLMWYLGKKVKPNFLLLNNAISQTHGGREVINESNFFHFLQEELSKVDFNYIIKDVEPFMEDRKEIQLLNEAMFKSLVKRSFNTSW